MPITYVYDGTDFQPISGVPGATGPAGPTAVSNDAGNQSVLGSDSLIYTPEFASGVYLPLAGGQMSGDIDMNENDIDHVNLVLGATANHLQLQASPGFALQMRDSAGTIVYQIQDGNNITVVASDTGTAKMQWRNDLSVMRMFTTLDMQGNQIVDQISLLELAGGEMTGALGLPSGNQNENPFSFKSQGGTIVAGIHTNSFSTDTPSMTMYAGAPTAKVASVGLAASSFTVVLAGNQDMQLSDNNWFRVGIVGTSTTGSVPNQYVSSVNGGMQRSTAVLLATVSAGADAIALRTGIPKLSGTAPDFESLDLLALLNYTLDRIDALEVHHP
jgi:hypothetical protein